MRVALALGSGGARGYAHIGVINELRDRGHQIVGIAGSSMGSLVGGLEAAGKLDQYSDWASSLTQRAVLRLLDPATNAPTHHRLVSTLALVAGPGGINRLRAFLLDPTP